MSRAPGAKDDAAAWAKAHREDARLMFRVQLSNALALEGVHLSPGREVQHLAHHAVHARAVPYSEQGNPGDPDR